MKESKKAIIRLINRIAYITSAALLMTAIVLGAVVSPAHAASGDDCLPCESAYQLNLSHVACDVGMKQVEVHFVLLDVPDGTTPGNLYFNMSINGGSVMTYFIAAPSKHTGNVWHYSHYFTGTGTYNIVSARVTVGTVYTYLHNPGSVTVSDAACAVSTVTVVPPTETTEVPPTVTTEVPPTETTEVPPTVTTEVPPTETTEVPPTVTTEVPPTETTEVPPTLTTEVPPTETTEVPPTVTTEVPPTETTEVPPTETTEVPPTETTEVPPTETTTPPVIHVLQSPSLSVDPYCTVNNQMQWTVENPNSEPINITSWSIDSDVHGAFTAAPGSNKITTSSLGTHTLTVYWGDGQSANLTYTIDVCPLGVPVTGAEVGGVLIPVTGVDDFATGALFAGISFGGLGLILTALRKFLHL